MKPTSCTKNRASLIKVIASIVLSMIICCPMTALSEDAPVNADKTDIQKARDIKLQRIAVTWYQQPIELSLHSGAVETGRLMVFEQGEFRLKTPVGLKNIPSHSVKSLTLKKQPKDLMLVGLTALGGAGLLSAATSLSNADAGKVTVAALIGGAAGFTLGWKFFYQDIVIQIE